MKLKLLYTYIRTFIELAYGVYFRIMITNICVTCVSRLWMAIGCLKWENFDEQARSKL